MNAFVTGSWAYGEPTEASDLDLVIRVDGVMMALQDSLRLPTKCV